MNSLFFPSATRPLITCCCLAFACALAAGNAHSKVRPQTGGTSATRNAPSILLGIDVLERENFRPLQGKRVGLLTHPAGVNRQGVSTIEVLRRAQAVNLVALFGPEHGIYGDERASVPIQDRTDERTGLPVFSLYGAHRKPTPEMLGNIDVLVVDLQDVGTRSYTFISCMRLAIEACFENGVAVVVLDRPNPLGGLKVDGPPMDREWRSYVGAFRVPYVHGLTIGELARMCASLPGVLDIGEETRKRGRLTVVPMRGWRRDMLWPDTGLAWVPTSPYIPTVGAAVGYAMTGLGAQLGGFRHGIGSPHPFRLLSFPGKTPEALAAELDRRNLRGLRFVPLEYNDARGRRQRGLYVEVSDWEKWRPTELSFHMMRLACEFTGSNPFAAASGNAVDLFNKHTGSGEWWQALTTQGASVPVEAFLSRWEREASRFQQETRRFHLYR